MNEEREKMKCYLKLNYFLILALCFIVFGNSVQANEKYKTKKNTYSYDPYYEENAPNKVRQYGNYEVRDREYNSPFTIEAYSKLMSSYVWRNVTRNDDPVLETGFALLASKFTFALTGFMDLTDYGKGVGYGDQSFEVTEIDISFSYADRWGDLMYSAEFKHYLFPNKYTPIGAKGRLENASTTEINFLLGYDVIMKPSLFISFDVDESQGFYIELGASHSFSKKFYNIPTRINIGGGIGIGSEDFNQYHFGVDSFTATGITLRANWEWMIRPNMMLTPELGVSFPFDSDISDAMDKAGNIQSSPTTIYFSLKFVYTM